MCRLSLPHQLCIESLPLEHRTIELLLEGISCNFIGIHFACVRVVFLGVAWAVKLASISIVLVFSSSTLHAARKAIFLVDFNLFACVIPANLLFFATQLMFFRFFVLFHSNFS